MQKTFWQKNQVFLTGLAGALVLALQQFISTPEGEIDWKVIGLSVALAIAGYVANEWRGKGVTVVGFIGVVAQSFVTIQTTGHFSWNSFILSVIIGFLSIVAPPPKPAAYEETNIIKNAKQQAEEIKQVEKQTPPPQI